MFTTANESDIGTNLLTGSFKDSDWVQAINQVASGQTAEAFSIGNYKAADALSLFLMAPVMDEKRVAGVLAFQLTLEQLYALAMNYRGLGESGEMVTAILQGDEAVMATPTRHDPMAAYQRKVKIGSPDAKPIQEAVRGQTGTGTFTDYRGIPVIAAWRYLPALKLGMVLKIDQSEAFFQNQLLANWFMGLGAVLFLLVVAISLSIARIISKPIRALTRASSRMASGEVGVRVDVHTGDEIELLANAFNQMATQLDTAHEESAARDWLNTGITTLDDVMRGEKDLSQLCTDIITTLARYLEVQVGTLSLADHEKTQLILTGSYAYTPKSGASTTFRFGEGWVGQAAQEKKSICIDKVMDGHLTVTSALGELPPENILCMPFLYEGDVAGVIELGSLHALNDRQLQLVDQVSERVAIAIHAAQSRENLQVLLEETQAQSEELQTREEELRATNEELTDQAKRNQSKWKNKNDA